LDQFRRDSGFGQVGEFRQYGDPSRHRPVGRKTTEDGQGMSQNSCLGFDLGLLAVIGLDEFPLLENIGGTHLTAAETHGDKFEDLFVGAQLPVQEFKLAVLLHQLEPGGGHPGCQGLGRGLDLFPGSRRIQKRRIPFGTNPAPQIHLIGGRQSEENRVGAPGRAAIAVAQAARPLASRVGAKAAPTRLATASAWVRRAQAVCSPGLPEKAWPTSSLRIGSSKEVHHCSAGTSVPVAEKWVGKAGDDGTEGTTGVQETTNATHKSRSGRIVLPPAFLQYTVPGFIAGPGL